MKRIQTVSYAPGRYPETPMVKIANNFLKKYGFGVGAEIEIEYADGVITIILKNEKV